MKEKLTVIRGNCDAEVDEMISEFQFHDYVLKEINGKKIYFTHGHKYNIEKIPYEEFEIMIYGHTHQGFIEEKEGYIFANPRINITTKMQHRTQLYNTRRKQNNTKKCRRKNNKRIRNKIAKNNKKDKKT